MRRKIIYLINPISGTEEKISLKKIIERKTREQNIDFEIVFSHADGDYGSLVKRIQQEQFTDVVICGGDGTINAVVAALKTLSLNFGIIPMGSGNGLAFAAKIPNQVKSALEIIFQGKASYVDAFTINEMFSCMLCGIGFDARVAHEFAKEKNRGKQTYLKISVINFFKAKPHSFEIQWKDRSFSTEAFFICVANSNQFGNHVTIAPRARLNDGLLDIVIVNKMSKFALPFHLIRQITGLNALTAAGDFSDKRNIMYFQTDSILIRNNEQAPLHIDGEPRETDEKFSIKVIKNCFRLLQA